MLRLLTGQRQRNLSLADKKKKFFKQFFSSDFHEWILDNKYYERAFRILVESFNGQVLDFFLNNKSVVFIKANGRLSCALSSLEKYHVVIIFPDLCQIFESASPMRGVAILAHELGHIYYNHSAQTILPLKAQLEADAFTASLGLGSDLQDVLLDYPKSEECRIRAEYMTSLMTVKDN